jgi:hypothetical protein
MLWSAVLLHLGTFFLTALVCHGELARSRPHASRLTEFYLWISVGGVLGGAFNALLAPLLFPIVIEYPLVLIVACMLRPRLPTAKSSWRENGLDLGLPMALALAMGSLALLLDRCQVQPDWLARMGTALLLPVSATLALLFVRRPARFALGVAAVLIVGCVHTQSWPDFVGRNFFGVVRVRCNRDYTELLHGTTSHGIQSRDPTLRDVPMTYYHRSGPLGQVIRAMDAQRPPRQLGVIGLGTGTIAAYGRPGERITFYEIDPIVERLARDDRWFTYLRDSRAKVDVVLGDARLSLERAPRGGYDLLVVDAFSSDAIPLHLLTREALRLYFDKLADDGVLAVHITNRYLNLAPIVARLAEDARLVCRDRSDDTRNAQVYASHWVMLSRHGGSLARLTADPGWQTTSAPPGTPLWTDDFSNILSAVGR